MHLDIPLYPLFWRPDFIREKPETQMTVTKRDLQSLQRQFKALEKKMDKLTNQKGWRNSWQMKNILNY